jgi:hypothetical protein
VPREAGAGHAAAPALAVGEQVEALGEEPPEELRAVAPAIEHDRDPALADEGPDLGEDGRQHRHQARIRLGRDDKEGLARHIIDPVVGRGGHGQTHPGDVSLGQGSLAVVHPHMPVDVEEAHRGPAVGHPAVGQGAAERGGPPRGGQTAELAPHRLDLGRAVEAQDPAEIVRRVLLEPLRALDPEQRHQQQRHERGAEAVERGAEAAVDLPGDGEDPARHQGGQGQQHPRMGHPGPGAEERGGIVQNPQVREQAIHAAVGGIRVERYRGGFVVRDRRGQVWVPRGRQPRRPVGHRGCGKSGQVWVPAWDAARQQELLRGPLVPPQVFQELPHGLRGDAQPAGDLPRRQALALPAAHQLLARSRQPGASGGVAPRVAQGGEPARLEPALIPPDAPHGVPERSGDLLLVGPALLHEAHHSVGFGHAIVRGVLQQYDAGDQDDPEVVLRPEEAAIIDDRRARRENRLGKEVLLFFCSRHGGSLPPRNEKLKLEKADRFGSPPLLMPEAAKTSCSTPYVRRSGSLADL